MALKGARATLSAASIESSSLDASLILSYLTHYTKVQLITHDDELLDDSLLVKFNALIEKRAKGYPVAYILGYKEFWGLKLKVNEHTLIPRPDTETLVQSALDCRPFGNVLDMGTGTGAIILALKSELKDNIKAYACDFSQGALEVAQENAKNLKLEVEFIESDWFSAIDKTLKFSMIVSNPPYIEDNDDHLKASSLPFEPVTALTSGPDGLDDIRTIASKAKDYLLENAPLLLEHGYLQGPSVQEIFKNEGYQKVATIKDLEGRDRVTLGFKA